jgi:hypothetical protein
MAKCYQTCTVSEQQCVAACPHEATEAMPVAVKTAPSERTMQREFSSYVKKYSKKYTHDEFFTRYTIFKANYNKIRLHNLSKSTFSMAVRRAPQQCTSLAAAARSIHPLHPLYSARSPRLDVCVPPSLLMCAPACVPINAFFCVPAPVVAVR